MNLLNWIANLEPIYKIIFGLATGLIVYILFRTFVYYVNQDAKKNGLSREDSKRQSEDDKLQHLLNLNR